MSQSDKFEVLEQDIFSSLEDIKGATYDRKAKYYDRLVRTEAFNRIIWGCSRQELIKFSAEAILHSKGTVLDIGCGSLAQTTRLYCTTNNQCTLFDRSIEMLKIAGGRLRERCGSMPPQVNLLQGNAFNLPFTDNTFDTICSFGTIHLFNNKQEFVNKALRVLKKNGRFYFYTMTSEKMIGHVFMSLFRIIHEFGEVWSERQYLSLFDNPQLQVNSYRVGSVLFIYGQKK